MNVYQNLIGFIGFAAISLISGCSSPNPTSIESDTPIDKTAIIAKADAPLFDGMGTHQHPITTKIPSAQLYFDQGLVLAFGFNHAGRFALFRRLND